MDASQNPSMQSLCRSMSKQYQRCFRLVTNDYAQRKLSEEYHRLRIWACAIGVFTISPASADNCLDNDEELRDYANQLLEDLQDVLSHVERYAKLELGLWDGNMSDSSDSLPDSESIVQSKMNLYLSQLQAIQNRLFALAALTRQPSTLVNNQKLDSFDFQGEYPNQYEEWITAFEQSIKFYIWRTFRSSELPRDLTLMESVCALPKHLIERLTSAAVLRRKVLILKSRRIRRSWENVDREMPTSLERKTFSSASTTSKISENVVAKQPNELSRNTSESWPKSVGLQILPGQKAESEKQPAFYHSSNPSVILRSKLDMPPPPIVPESRSHFTCFVCGLLLEREMLQPDTWRKHVLEDIDSFVCLFEDCSRPSRLYKNSTQWYEHMQTHRVTWTCMIAGHSHLKFASQEELRSHMQTFHAVMSSQQREMLLRRGSRASSKIFDCCPLCEKTLAELKQGPSFLGAIPGVHQADHELTLHHLETHMYEIALFSLLPCPEPDVISNMAMPSVSFSVEIAAVYNERIHAEALLSVPSNEEEEISIEPLYPPTDLVGLISENTEAFRRWSNVCNEIQSTIISSSNLHYNDLSRKFSTIHLKIDECPQSQALRYEVADQGISNGELLESFNALGSLAEMTIHPAPINKRILTLYLAFPEYKNQISSMASKLKLNLLPRESVQHSDEARSHDTPPVVQILVIGSLALEEVRLLDKLSRSGGAFLGQRHKGMGGRGCNVAISTYRASNQRPHADPSLTGALGRKHSTEIEGASARVDNSITVGMMGAVANQEMLTQFSDLLHRNSIDTRKVVLVTRQDSEDEVPLDQDGATQIIDGVTGHSIETSWSDAWDQWPLEGLVDIEVIWPEEPKPKLLIVTTELKQEAVECIVDAAYEAGIDILVYASIGYPFRLVQYPKITHLVVQIGCAERMLGYRTGEVAPDEGFVFCDKFIENGVKNVVLIIGQDRRAPKRKSPWKHEFEYSSFEPESSGIVSAAGQPDSHQQPQPPEVRHTRFIPMHTRQPGVYYKSVQNGLQEGSVQGFDNTVTHKTLIDIFVGVYAAEYMKNRGSWNISRAVNRASSRLPLRESYDRFEDICPWEDDDIDEPYSWDSSQW